MNAGTILYIPVAQAEGGATVTVKGQLYGPTLKLDGTDITTGTAVTIATDSTRYVPLSVEGTGSLYLTGIAIDYAAGSPAATSHTVTVGPNGQYRTIQAALDANDSSETDRLVLKITPGDYREKITVTKPGVTFANADVTAKRAVTIRASYYSSNTFDADGKFVPQDEFDLGTNVFDIPTNSKTVNSTKAIIFNARPANCFLLDICISLTPHSRSYFCVLNIFPTSASAAV